MANHDILLLSAQRKDNHPDQSKIVIKGGPLTKVKRGDTITWRSKNTNFEALLIIFDNRETIKLFSKVPAPQSILKQQVWKAKISKLAGRDVEYKYTICWLQGGRMYAYDPKIQVN
jgi:hypothetical protein